MRKIRLLEAFEKKDIVIRGGNQNMRPDDIYMRIPYAKLVEMGFVKDGETPDSSTASKVRRALDIETHEETGINSNFPDLAYDVFTISLRGIESEPCVWCGSLKGARFVDWLRNTHLTIRPEEPWEGRSKKSESALNRITMKDVRKALDKLQEKGQLNNALHEITSLASYVGNHMANTDPDVSDNKLNGPERKIVMRAILAHIISQFGYTPEDLR